MVARRNDMCESAGGDNTPFVMGLCCLLFVGLFIGTCVTWAQFQRDNLTYVETSTFITSSMLQPYLDDGSDAGQRFDGYVQFNYLENELSISSGITIPIGQQKSESQAYMDTFFATNRTNNLIRCKTPQPPDYALDCNMSPSTDSAGYGWMIFSGIFTGIGVVICLWHWCDRISCCKELGKPPTNNPNDEGVVAPVLILVSPAPVPVVNEQRFSPAFLSASASQPESPSKI